MKCALLTVLVASSLSLFSCASAPLEQIMEARQQARIDAANANRPITRGAADGLGSIIADSAPPKGTTLGENAPAK
jgi:hypothetical protein